MDHPQTIVGLGELLWDLLPSGPQLGGAPANFAYCSHLLGNRAIVASRIGSDERGREARALLLRSGLTDQFLQTDPDHPTGTVNVRLDSTGQPNFEIAKNSAWDFLTWTDDWRSLAQSADAVCFGTLAQRSQQSRQTILKFPRRHPPRSPAHLRRKSASEFLFCRNHPRFAQACERSQTQPRRSPPRRRTRSTIDAVMPDLFPRLSGQIQPATSLRHPRRQRQPPLRSKPGARAPGLPSPDKRHRRCRRRLHRRPGPRTLARRTAGKDE